jgi:hypothetical protein
MEQWLYRKNNNEVPTRWRAGITDNGLIIEVEYGIVGKASRFEAYKVTQKNATAELESRYRDKRKTGYMSIEDIKDDGDISRSPVEDGDINNLYQYLAAYLPKYRTNENNGGLLPMLAKSYTGKVWDKVPVMIGQYKINGLRCFISAEYNNGDMFKPIKLRFQSREGIYWSTLSNLEEYLLTVLPEDLITAMIEEQWSLDGEIYLPGYTVNQINHFVKDANCVENKALQFWCYDLAVPEMSQSNRLVLIDKYLDNRITNFHDYKEHLNNDKRLIRLPSIFITNDNEALKYRDEFIGLGFEGLILRNPSADYQYGRRRVGYMEKFKSATDGKFVIVDIYKEAKRELPIILCQNDVNTAKFETRLSATHEYQQMILRDKHLYIGKHLFVEFGERSGVEKVPFHIKKTQIILDE